MKCNNTIQTPSKYPYILHSKIDVLSAASFAIDQTIKDWLFHVDRHKLIIIADCKLLEKGMQKLNVDYSLN